MPVGRALKSVARKLPGIRRLVAQRDALGRQCEALAAERDRLQHANDALALEYYRLQRAAGFVPPGHFYSPIPSLADVERDEASIFGSVPRSIAAVELNEAGQVALLAELAQYYPEIPFPAQKTPGRRYYFENPSYSYSDAVFLYGMIRHLRPRRIVEVGSGFSSCAMLDTNDLFFGGSIALTFIDPFPEALLGLIGEEDKRRTRIVPERLQDVALREFEALEANDILFIDSTHVSKAGSDVNRIFATILPALAPGVYIHIHDIFYPFEYPKEWIYAGRAWNELYVLRAFLQYNRAFRIVLMNNFLERFHQPFLQERMPLVLKNPGGSLWLRKEQSA
jgi:hypothetical protein